MISMKVIDIVLHYTTLLGHRGALPPTITIRVKPNNLYNCFPSNTRTGKSAYFTVINTENTLLLNKFKLPAQLS